MFGHFNGAHDTHDDNGRCVLEANVTFIIATRTERGAHPATQTLLDLTDQPVRCFLDFLFLSYVTHHEHIRCRLFSMKHSSIVDATWFLPSIQSYLFTP